MSGNLCVHSKTWIRGRSRTVHYSGCNISIYPLSIVYSTLPVFLYPIEKVQMWKIKMLDHQLSNGWRGTSSPDLTGAQGTLLTHCWPANLPFCSPVATTFTLWVYKDLCFLRFRSLHAPLVFIFLTKLEWVGRCFLKLVLLPLNLSSLSSPWECKLHQGRIFSYVLPCCIPGM